MGLFDYFSPAGKMKRLGKRLTERYGPPETRQKAIVTLSEMGTPEALAMLLLRFTITSEPRITDAEEKEDVFRRIVDAEESSIAPLKEFVRRQESVSWALRALAELLTPPEVVGIVVGELEHLGNEYTREPDKKVQLITWLAEHRPDDLDARVGPALIPFLADRSDDVKLAAARTLAPLKLEAAREPMLQALVEGDQGARVRRVLMDALADGAFGVQGYREKVEALLVDPFFVDKSGVLKRR
jgi:HEAT repeat protein